MNKKIVGIFVCILLIVTALPVTVAMNVKTILNVNENNYSKPYQNTPTNSPDIITIKITAKVINISDPYNLLGGIIKKDDVITGKYTYDTATPDTEPDPTLGEYIFYSSPCGFNINAGGFVFKSDTSSIEPYYYYIANDAIPFGVPIDGMEMGSWGNSILSNGLTVDQIWWGIYDLSCTALNSTDLPTTAPVISDYIQSEFDGGINITGHDPNNSNKKYQINADVTKATKSKTRDIHFITQPILIWLLERFQNTFPILQKIIQKLELQ